MEVYKAESLFTDVSLRKEDMHVFRQTVYSCPKCNEKVVFSEDDFQRYALNKDTEYKGIFPDSFVGNYNSFLEFECPKCKVKTRVNFGVGYGGKFPEIKIDSIMTE